MPIEDFFHPAEVPGNFPLLRLVALRKQEGFTTTFELRRPREMFGFRKAKIVIHFHQKGHEAELDEDGWDDDLNSGLIALGVKADNSEQEKDRFTLTLRAALRSPEKYHGDGDFNTLIVQYLRQNDFRDHPEVAAVLKLLPFTQADRSRKNEDCLKMIDAAVKGRAMELTEKLQYNMPEAWNILAGAMARYVDERFSVTNRRLLGLL